MAISRREFTRLAGVAWTAALAARAGITLAQEPAGPGATAQLSVEQRLAPIAPELRPSAREMIENGFPPITEEFLRNMPADGGPPPAELLPDIPVLERDVAADGLLPAVKVFVVNADPARRRPAILHTHGGGFVLGSARGELRYLQETAKALDCTIVSVEYRLAPQARYTQSTEDAYAALKWLYSNAASLGVDRRRIAVMGESAGGGHAALLAIKAHDRGEVPVIFQSLVYPMLDDRTGSTTAVPPHIATVGWSPAENRLGWKSFLGVAPGTAEVPAAAVPARRADLSGLPPAWIGVGGVDLFVTEDIEYALRLTRANVPTELLVLPGGYHGFDRMAPATSLAQAFTRSKLDALRRALGSDAPVE
jgi:acetyl esterase/lipase